MTNKEMDKRVQELWDMFEATDRRFKETDRRLKEAFEETDRRLKEAFEETDRRFKDTDRQLKEAFEETRKNINALTGKWGMFVEGLVIPAVKSLFKERGIEIHQVYQRAKAARNGQNMEVDILATNSDYSVLIEAKSTLTVEDVNDHLQRLSQFKDFFPRYADTKVIGAVAGIVITEDADKYAYRQGLYVIGQSGDAVEILNDQAFQPNVW